MIEGQDVVKYVSSQLNEWLENSSDDKTSMVYTVKKKAVGIFVDSSGEYIKKIYDGIKTATKTATTQASSALSEIFTDIRNDVEKKAKAAVSGALTNMTTEIKSSVKSGASKLKETINTKVNVMFGDSGTSVETSGMSSMISFSNIAII